MPVKFTRIFVDIYNAALFSLAIISLNDFFTPILRQIHLLFSIFFIDIVFQNDIIKLEYYFYYILGGIL